MPDRYGEEPRQVADDQPADTYVTRRLIASCDLCDSEGIRNGFACDHVDHRPAAKRGMAKIRAAMGWDR